MNEQPVSVSSVSWRELCPWTIIFRTLPIASGITVLVWALVGVVVTPIGWLIAEKVCLNQNEIKSDPAIARIVEMNHTPYNSVLLADQSNNSELQFFGTKLSGPKLVFDQMILPYSTMLKQGLSGRQFCYLLFGAVWMLFTWCFVGCAIARVSLLRLTRDEPVDLDDAFDFAWDRFWTCVSAVSMPLLAVIGLTIPMALFGLLLGADWGVVLGGIFWFIVLLFSTAIAVFLLGLMFGWPMMIASVSAEGQNAFDAMTRSYAYVFQRPIKYLMYILIAIVFGGLCWLVVAALTTTVINIGFWGTSWGANRFGGNDRIAVVKGDQQPDSQVTPDETGAPTATGKTTLERGQQFIGFWNGALRTVASAFLYGLFWCMSAAVYLLLRKDVDETEMDEIYVFDEQRTYDLPPLKSDENGIPQVQNPVPVNDDEPEPE